MKDPSAVSFMAWEMKDAFEGTFELGQPWLCRYDAFSFSNAAFEGCSL